jgi:solute carrier family 13 (sodium-dependent dicarboxylate transporter), member 2/3/5
MNLLQNAIILTTGFLLSQILIASKTHYRLIAFILRHSGSGFRALLTSVLLIAYILSIFLSNTVVVLSLIPVIKRLVDFLPEPASKTEVGTLFYLALTFGATTGGFASLTGNPLNVFALSLAELNKLEGYGNLNFFSWLMIGLPASMVLVAAARWIILYVARNCSDSVLTYPGSAKTALLPHRPLLFFAANICFITAMTGIQFFLKPKPVLLGFSYVDLLFLLYGAAFLFFTFILPRKKRIPGGIRKNTLFLIFYLAAFPVILVSRICRETETHLHIPMVRFYGFLDALLLKSLNALWFFFFSETIESLERPNFNAILSINRIILDIPYFGLLLIAVFSSLLYLAVATGDNPVTPDTDGYLITWGTSLIVRILEPLSSPLLFLPALNLAAAFSSELLSNTAIVIILAPLVISMSPHTSLSALTLLLSVTIAASAAFMTPMASPSNTLAFGGIDHVSLKTVIKAGLIMNLVSAILITTLFLALSPVL